MICVINYDVKQKTLNMWHYLLGIFKEGSSIDAGLRLLTPSQLSKKSITNPRGETLAEILDKEGIIYADIDTS